MKTPIEMILQKIAWRELHESERPEDVPDATHIGVLDVSGILVRLYQLKNGSRVVDAQDVAMFLHSLPAKLTDAQAEFLNLFG